MATGDRRNVENLLHATKELTEDYVGNINDLHTDRNSSKITTDISAGGVAVSTPKPNASKDFILNESYLQSEKNDSNGKRDESFSVVSDDGQDPHVGKEDSVKLNENVTKGTLEDSSVSDSNLNSSNPLLERSLTSVNDNRTEYNSINDSTASHFLFETPNSGSKRKFDDLSESGEEFKGFTFTATDFPSNDSNTSVLKRKRSGNSRSDEDDSVDEEFKDRGMAKPQPGKVVSGIVTHATVELSEPGEKQPSPDNTSKLLNLERGGADTQNSPNSQNSSTHFIHNESHGNSTGDSLKPDSQVSGSHTINIDDDDDEDKGVEDLESEGSEVETDVEDNASDSRSSLFVRAVPDPDIDKHLPDTVTLLTTPEGAKVYLVGTAHFSTESQEDVAMIIRAVQPHVVLVELCQARVNILQLDDKTILEEAKNINLEKIQSTIKQNGLFHGVMYLLLLSMSAHLTKQLGMAPGGEFRRAFSEAKRVPACLIHLGDRPIQITLKRALASLSWWQTLRLTWHLLMSKEPISKEEVERCKRRDLLEEMLAEMAGEFPALGTVFVNERDVFLAHSLQLAATPVANSPAGPVPARVVGVVGIGHVPGIVQNWGKVSSADIPPIMQLPPPSLSGRVVKFTLKASCVCVVVWGVSKLLPQSGLVAIRSSIQGLFSSA